MAGKNDDYYFFKSAKLNKHQANVVGVAIIFGFVGALAAALMPVSRLVAYAIIAVFVIAGYIIGGKILK